MNLHHNRRIVPASEYDALCDIVAEMTDQSFDDLVPRIRRCMGDQEADWLVKIIDGHRAREFFGV